MTTIERKPMNGDGFVWSIETNATSLDEFLHDLSEAALFAADSGPHAEARNVQRLLVAAVPIIVTLEAAKNS